MQLTIYIITFSIISLVIFAFATSKKTVLTQPAEEIERKILEEHVLFYQQLSAGEKARFESAVQGFLNTVKITGVKTTVTDMDKVFVAAAATIPIFAFPGWTYRNIHEVLLYPGSFGEGYKTEGADRNIAGMVGNGPMQNVMILSQYDLQQAFLNHSDKANTPVHEFVHLLDQADGAIDGIPEALLPHPYAIPWLQLMHQEIKQIAAGTSDINPYAATNQAEFLAVTSEYFFEQPHLMQEKHPELYEMLERMFTAPSGRM